MMNIKIYGGNMKKILIIISLIFLVIVNVEKINGEEIDFNSSAIRVMDSKGAVLISSTKLKGRYVEVYPIDGYEYGKKYKMFIGKNLNKKENMNEEITMNFTTKSLLNCDDFEEYVEQGTLKGDISKQNGNLIIDGNELKSNLRLDQSELVYKIIDLFLQENRFNNKLEVSNDDLLKIDIMINDSFKND